MSRQSTLPKRLQPMLATLTDAPFDDAAWIFEDKYDGFRMVSEIRRGKVALYSRNGKIISDSYIEVAKALEGATKLSSYTALSTSCSSTAKTCGSCPLIERKKRLKVILPRHKLIAFSNHRKVNGKKFFAEAERRRLEGIMAKRADSPYASGSRTADWLKVKTAQRQEVVIAGFTPPRRTRPFFGALT